MSRSKLKKRYADSYNDNRIQRNICKTILGKAKQEYSSLIFLLYIIYPI